MFISKVSVDCERITDWSSFHSVFAEAFGFPDFYGRNMNAWIDCMSYLDMPEAEMTSVHSSPGTVVTLDLQNIQGLRAHCPELYAALIECSAFVNWRRNKVGRQSVIALSFSL
jgi:RNAse (barnase) inhibitor barstar